jgi:3-deoxy-manno-octulosonate cytidylyltransferase (CMP-KDO synthetase)
VSVLVVIPARYGSSRLPGKPLLEICGIPLVVRVLFQVQRSGLPCGVATDDERIAHEVRRAGGTVWMTSPDCVSGTDRVAEVARLTSATHLINVQGDEPFVDPEALLQLSRALQEGAALVTLACPLSDSTRFFSPNTVKVVLDARGRALYFSRAPIPFPRDAEGAPAGALQHIGVYGYARETLLELSRTPPHPLEELEKLEQLRALALGVPIQVLTVPGGWLGVDTAADLEEARRQLADSSASAGA